MRLKRYIPSIFSKSAHPRSSHVSALAPHPEISLQNSSHSGLAIFLPPADAGFFPSGSSLFLSAQIILTFLLFPVLFLSFPKYGLLRKQILVTHSLDSSLGPALFSWVILGKILDQSESQFPLWQRTDNTTSVMGLI